MLKIFTFFLLGISAFLIFSSSFAKQANAENLDILNVNECAKDLKTYCSSITPGRGRKVACLISHSDKIQPRCRLTAFLSGKAIAVSIINLERMAFSCASDIRQYCEGELPGGGRVYDCIKKNKVTLLPACKKALPEFERMFLK